MPEEWAKVDPHPAWCKNSVNYPEVVYEVPSLKTAIEHRMGHGEGMHTVSMKKQVITASHAPAWSSFELGPKIPSKSPVC